MNNLVIVSSWRIPHQDLLVGKHVIWKSRLPKLRCMVQQNVNSFLWYTQEIQDRCAARAKDLAFLGCSNMDAK